jgi:hypothetical protein
VEVGNHRAYIFLDDNNMRYAVTGPVDWSEIIHNPFTIEEFTNNEPSRISTDAILDMN